MKPLSELVEELDEEMNETVMGSGESHAYAVCIGKLQAWLREADEWVANNRYQAVKLLGEAGNLQVNAEDVLRALLGTTRTEGKK